jgi:hypothetical protein
MYTKQRRLRPSLFCIPKAMERVSLGFCIYLEEFFDIFRLFTLHFCNVCYTISLTKLEAHYCYPLPCKLIEYPPGIAQGNDAGRILPAGVA